MSPLVLDLSKLLACGSCGPQKSLLGSLISVWQKYPQLPQEISQNITPKVRMHFPLNPSFYCYKDLDLRPFLPWVRYAENTMKAVMIYKKDFR